ncbi:MAG: hypothetical protein ACREBV_07085, partial [Candidatus Zixiibacteriota bacterium]
MSQILTLKPDKEHLLESRHPWIFSGALKEIPADIKHGSIVKVANSKGAIVATGTFSNSSNIAVRVFSFADTNINADWFWQKIEGCDKRRTIMGFGPDFDTTGYRIVFGEADGIPGLVVDRYGDTLVVQLATAGIDKLMSLVVAALNEIFKPRAIFERSDIANRKEEQIGERTGTLYG